MRRTLCLLALSLAAPALAWAQDPAAPAPAVDPAAAPPPVDATATAAAPAGDPLAKENWPTSGVDRPLALSGGMLQVDVPIGIGLNKGAGGDPIKVPLVIYYGVTNELQLALIHGTGLCLAGDSCGKVYNDVFLHGLYSLMGRGSNLELAAWAQVGAVALSPKAALQAQLGVAANWVVGGNVAIIPIPGIAIGLTEREPANKEALSLPVYAYFRAHANVSPFIVAGISGPLSGFGDGFTVPAGVGVLVAPNAMLDFGAKFDLASLVTREGVDAMGNKLPKPGVFDGKSVTVWASIRPL
jgi:hypothetical protein